MSSSRFSVLFRFSSLTVVVAVALASSSSSQMVLAQCPCHPQQNGKTNSTICDDTSLTSIPHCVSDNITSLGIFTPSIPLAPATIRRFTNLMSLKIAFFDNPQLSKTFLAGQKNILSLEISETALDYVDNEWFQYAPKITTLSLASNKIASMAMDTFSSLRLLEEVRLDHNQLTTLPPTLFDGTKLKNLTLGDNPWHCDCELATFLQWTRDHGVKIVDQAFCLHPVELRGLDLVELTPKLGCRK